MADQFAPGPTASSFDLSDKPSMGDPEFVEGRVRVMLAAINTAMHEADNPPAAVAAIVAAATTELSPGNPDYVQTLDTASLGAFLRARGLGTDDTGPEAPVGCLLNATAGLFVDALMAFREGEIDTDAFKFRVDAAVEDCTALLMGLDNSAE